MGANEIVADRPQDDATVQELRRSRQMLGDAHPLHGGRNRIVVRARQIALGVTTTLGIEGVDVAGAAAEPDHDAGIRLAVRKAVAPGCTRRRGADSQTHARAGHGRCLDQIPSCTVPTCHGVVLLSSQGTSMNSGVFTKAQITSS